MNNRWGKPPHTEKLVLVPVAGSGITGSEINPEYHNVCQEINPLPFSPVVKSPARTNNRKNHTLHKDSLIILKHSEISHIISEDYSYKTDAYYTILQMEMEGLAVKPSSAGVIDAFVVPICLERAKLAGIPVCEWEISQGYVPLPAILYGLNYFATTSEFVTVYDNESAKEAVGHFTNKGKYPFCYQKISDDARIFQCNVLFGKTIGCNDTVAHLAEKMYALFSIPLMQMVLVNTTGHYTLSSLSPVRYSHLAENERSLLEAYISHQEFL